MIRPRATINTLFWGIRKSVLLKASVFSNWRTNLSSFHAIVYGRMIDGLIAARKAANITQVELGERIGQRQTFVSKFELGERRLDPAEFVKVSRAIGADPFEIMRKAELD
ncbi:MULTISPECIES: helix-turn-helix domain-containing protein [unclassified Ensifer]|uniref:helix-turn-helix domain-containing protein n=1 Tax=unclassified Ensifer TaxID=2633371 RepID=UPI00300F98E9